MKTIYKISQLVLIAIILTSCGKIKDLADVEFDTTLSSNLEIDVQDVLKSGLAGYQFSDTATLDPTSDEEVKKYIDNIEDWDVNEITATVISVTKDNVVFSAGTYFEIFNNTNSATWTLDSDFSVIVGAEYVLGNDMGQWNNVRQILKKNKIFYVALTGKSTENNVFVIIKLSIDATVTANPL